MRLIKAHEWTEPRPGSIETVFLSYSPRPQRKAFSRLRIAILILFSFGAGFALSHLTRPVFQSQEVKPPVSDFAVALPEGKTVVTVFDPGKDNSEVARLTIGRQGDVINGIPYNQRELPARHTLSVEDIAFFRRELGNSVSLSEPAFQRANKIRSWLINNVKKLSLPGLSTRVPREAYEQMRQGKPVLCGNLTEIYVALCEAMGLTARPVGLSVMIRSGNFGVDTHAAAEVWISELGGWVYEDPTFDCYWKIDGKPASALAIHDALMAGKQPELAPRTPSTLTRLQANYIDPRMYFRHLSYEYGPGGPLLYFAEKRLEPLSLAEKNWVQTGDRKDIMRLDTQGNFINFRGSEIAPGIFAQLIGTDLFIRDRREGTRGIRVRSSSGLVQGCAYVHERADELGLFRSNNLVQNPLFREINESGQLADRWSVAGPVEAMTVAGGQAMAAQAGGKLWQRIQVRPHSSYLLYARVSVSRGVVNWSLGDSGRGSKSVGTLQPERISEVVSDVVETQSGYLDIGFEVPAGGAFRVIDVIVAEAPRFTGELTAKN